MKKPRKPAAKPAKTARKPTAGKASGNKAAARKPAKTAAKKPATAAKRAAAPAKRARRPAPRKEQALVRFSDAAVIKAGWKPPFPHSDGEYAEPDIVIPGGDEPPGTERDLPCPGSVVIYSSWADWVPNCNGLGAGGGNNAVVAKALANAQKAAAKIKCADGCTKRVNEIWRGWDCGPEGKKFLLIGAVELAVICQIEL